MQIHFDRIYIIESLQPGDKLTGTDLHNNLLAGQSTLHSDFQSVLRNPVDKSEWNQLFAEIVDDCRQNGHFPIIHFEVHGDSEKEGLRLTSKELVTWEELYQNLVLINIAIRNELFVTMAVCFGNFWLSSAILNRPAAFRGMVGSFHELYENDLIIRYETFYRELFSSFDFNKAYDALKQANTSLPNHYGCYSGEEIFALAFTGYEKSHCSPEALKARAHAAMEANGNMSRRERRQFERDFIKEELRKRESYFRQCYQKFFMLDCFPELAATIGFGNSLRKMKEWFNHV